MLWSSTDIKTFQGQSLKTTQMFEH